MPSSSSCDAVCAPPSLPTRRSSDLTAPLVGVNIVILMRFGAVKRTRQVYLSRSLKRRVGLAMLLAPALFSTWRGWGDLFGSGSTAGRSEEQRLNSSHVAISYAVFFLMRCRLCSTLSPYTTLFRSYSTSRWGEYRNIDAFWRC